MHLVVDDLPSSRSFYQDLLGLAPVSESGTVCFLATGKGEEFDLALEQGAPALHHFAFTVAGSDDLTAARGALADAGVQTTELAPGCEPGVAAGLRFALPSGHAMELVLMESPTVFTPTPLVDSRHYAGIGPVMLEHITMTCGDVEEVASFLIGQLGFSMTESVQPPNRACATIPFECELACTRWGSAPEPGVR